MCGRLVVEWPGDWSMHETARVIIFLEEGGTPNNAFVWWAGCLVCVSGGPLLCMDLGGFLCVCVLGMLLGVRSIVGGWWFVGGGWLVCDMFGSVMFFVRPVCANVHSVSARDHGSPASQPQFLP